MKPVVFFLALVPFQADAQDYAPPAAAPRANTTEWNLGLGLGLDYGGIGLQLQCRPAAPLVMFAGGGYALAGLGYNAGVQGRILPAAKWCPYVVAMYGYNAVIMVKGASEYNEIYFGPSIGFGVENHKRGDYRSFWRFQLLVPFRPDAFEKDMNDLKANPNVKIESEPPPFAFSVGYHFGI